MAAVVDNNQNIPTGLDLDYIDVKKPFLYNQPALSFVLNGPLSAQKLPTQLIYPNRQVSLGSIPSRSSWMEELLSEETEEASSNIDQLRQAEVTVYTSVNEQNTSFDSHLKQLTFCFSICIALQIMWIVVILSGGYFLPVNQTSFQDAEHVGSTFQRVVYVELIMLHLLPIGGILYRTPWLLYIYNSLILGLACLIYIFCIYSILDILVLALIFPTRYIGGKICYYISPHVFRLKTN